MTVQKRRVRKGGREGRVRVSKVIHRVGRRGEGVKGVSQGTRRERGFGWAPRRRRGVKGFGAGFRSGLNRFSGFSRFDRVWGFQGLRFWHQPKGGWDVTVSAFGCDPQLGFQSVTRTTETWSLGPEDPPLGGGRCTQEGFVRQGAVELEIGDFVPALGLSR